jgi:hypothetical protein
LAFHGAARGICLTIRAVLAGALAILLVGLFGFGATGPLEPPA